MKLMQSIKASKLQYKLLLIVTVAMWGAAFPLMKNISYAVDSIPFIALRMTIATVALLIINAKNLKKITKKMIISGAIYGVLLTFSSFFQVQGIRFTTATNAGFIGTTYVIFMPLFVFALTRKKPTKRTIVGIVIVVLGLLFICGIVSISPIGISMTSLNVGDLLTLAFSLLTCIYLLVGDHMTKKFDVCLITFVHAAFAALSAWIIMPFSGQTTMNLSNPTILLSVIYCGVFSCALGYLFTLIAQKHLDPTTTSIFWSIEPVFVMIFAAIIPDMFGNVEYPTVISLIGGILVLTGVAITSFIKPKPACHPQC